MDAEGAEIPGEVLEAEAKLKRRKKADHRGKKVTPKPQETWSQNQLDEQENTEVRTGRPPSRAPCRADAWEQVHTRGEGAHTNRLGSRNMAGQPRPPHQGASPATARPSFPKERLSVQESTLDPAGRGHLPAPCSLKLGVSRPRPC